MKKIFDKFFGQSIILIILEGLAIVQIILICGISIRNSIIDTDTYCKNHGYHMHDNISIYHEGGDLDEE